LDKQLVDIAIKARGTPTESLHFGILDDSLRALVVSALDAPPAHGPFRQIVYFPINDFLLHLFRLGRLTAFVDRLDGSGSRAVMLAEWAVLSIDWFGDPQRLCAVRPTLRSVAQVWKGQGSSIEGIETVRVPREEILREFPENPPPFLDDKGSDEAATVLIREAIAANGRPVGQNTGAEIVRAKFPTFPRDRARELTKQLTGNDKPGPKGSRKNHAK
jgi:hypothetical protein